MLRSVNRWLEANRWAGDAAVATGLLLITVLVYAPARDLRGFGLSVLLIVPLYARRSRPRTVLVTVTLVCLLQLALLHEPVFGDVAAPLAVHAVTAQVRDRRWGIGALITGLIGALLGARLWTTGWAAAPGEFVLLAGAAAGTIIAAYLVGARQREQREHADEQLSALRERNRLLAVDRDQRAEMAAAAERARIARELHDVIAHHMSVMVIQAGAARRLLEADPDQARGALAAVEDAGRRGLEAVPGLLRALRTDGRPDGLAPQPTLAELDALVAQVAAAGLPVDLRIEGTPRPLPAAVDLSAYRVAQEALTNTLKHAAPCSATVAVERKNGSMIIEVSDTGPGVRRADRHGRGLVGIAERVSMCGGVLEHGNGQDGGFRLRAVLPLP
jgi:signal transduction histidine kinase